MEESTKQLDEIWADCITDHNRNQHKGNHSPCIVKDLPAPGGYKAQIVTRTRAPQAGGGDTLFSDHGSRARIFQLTAAGSVLYSFESGEWSGEAGTKKKVCEVLNTLAYVISLKESAGNRGKIQGPMHG